MSKSTVTVKDLIHALTECGSRGGPTFNEDAEVHLEIVVDGKRGTQPCFDILASSDRLLLVSKEASDAGSLDFLPEYKTDGTDTGVLQ